VAIDEHGRVLVLDQADDRLLGETIDAALVGILTGNGSARRLRDDGPWRPTSRPRRPVQTSAAPANTDAVPSPRTRRPRSPRHLAGAGNLRSWR
jgi:hypothetical protein